MTPYLAQNAYWLGPLGLTLFILLVSRYWLRPFFWRIFLSVVPLALVAAVTAAAYTNLDVEEYRVVASETRVLSKPKTEDAKKDEAKEGEKKDEAKKDEPKKEEPKERLNRQVDYSTDVAALSPKDVERLSAAWFQSQKRITNAAEWHRVEGVGEAVDGKYKTIRYTFGVPESTQSVKETQDLKQSILDGLNESKVRFRFNLGVDLAGGTILVYEEDVQADKKDRAQSLDPSGDLAIALKRRIDPANLLEITIRPIPTTPARVEIILPMRSAKGATQGSSAVERVKNLIRKVGSLEFRVLADTQEEGQLLETAKAMVADVTNYDNLPAPEGYAWVEFDEKAVQEANWSETSPEGFGHHPVYRDRGVLAFNIAVYHASKVNRHFCLTKIPSEGAKVTGEDLRDAQSVFDPNKGPVAHFTLQRAAADRMQELTQPAIGHEMATILDRKIASYATIQSALRDSVEVTMGKDSVRETQKRVDELVRVLKAGALPTTLKPDPVSELTMGPGLGQDTISKGTNAVIWGFAAVVVFMIVYYRFSGFVASVALLANLLFTIGFMVTVKAPFTLPGVAGLVLMVAMAVDSNVLIYERIRDERERGSGLALAIRNAYQLSFPVIIDTHLTSIFTGIVLYVVGNDQLKGFSISMVVGLVISLFTSLYMTRLLFDIFLAKGWLRTLRMSSISTIMRWFGWPNIDFMRVRNVCFAGSVILSLVSLTAVMVRGERGFDIDFTGGTAYTVEFKEPRSTEDVRATIAASTLPDPAVDALYRGSGYTKNASVTDGRYPGFAPGGVLTPNFTFRTTLKDRDQVRKTVSDAFGDQLVWGEAKAGPIKKTAGARLDHEVELTFVNRAASRDQVLGFVDSYLAEKGVKQPSEFYEVQTVQEPGGGQAAPSRVLLKFAVPEGVTADEVVNTMVARGGPLYQPKSERLENFDSQLATEIQGKALAAIILSWLAICMFLWFRFGSWSYGLAAVLCLIHDVLVTVGCVALAGTLAGTWIGNSLMFTQFKLDLPAIAALLTLVGYTVNDKIVNFERIREVRGKSPELTTKMINESLNQTLSRTLLTGITVVLVLLTLYIAGGEGIHLFSFIILLGTIIGTYSSVYVAAPLLLIFGEGKLPDYVRNRQALAAVGSRE